MSFLPLGMITVVRLILRFGAAFEIDPDCGRLKAILSDMTFQKGIARTETLTVRQCEDVIAAAGLPSIALAQALQFELCLRHQSGKRNRIPVRS